MPKPEQAFTLERRGNGWSIRGLFRPALAFFIAGAVLTASIHLVYVDRLEGNVWFAQWMSLVGMVISFMFGERAALKSRDSEQNERKQS